MPLHLLLTVSFFPNTQNFITFEPQMTEILRDRYTVRQNVAASMKKKTA